MRDYVFKKLYYISMKIHLVTLSNNKCKKGQNKLINSAKLLNIFDNYFTWDFDTDYKTTDFYKNNLPISSQPKGVGYWIWKPFLILEAFKKIDENDIVIYHDSGRPCYDWKFDYEIKDFIDEIIKNHKGVGITFGPFKHGIYCKKDCFDKMNCETDQFRNHKQLSATWSIWQKNDFSTQILNEWLMWNTHPDKLVTDEKSNNPEPPNFDCHRHDQAILTNILLKHVFQGNYKPLFCKPGIYEKNINNFIKHKKGIKKSIFISIPKNASNSVHKLLNVPTRDRSNPNDLIICDNHCRSILLQQRYPDFDKRYKFCIVRNPYERTQSWFLFHKYVLKLKPYIDLSFTNWIEKGCPHHWKVQNGTDYIKNNLTPLLQYTFIYDEDMNLLVDKVCKFETLDKDISDVFTELNIPSKHLSKINCSKEVNAKEVEYTEETKNMIFSLLYKDFELFNYF